MASKNKRLVLLRHVPCGGRSPRRDAQKQALAKFCAAPLLHPQRPQPNKASQVHHFVGPPAHAPRTVSSRYSLLLFRTRHTHRFFAFDHDDSDSNLNLEWREGPGLLEWLSERVCFFHLFPERGLCRKRRFHLLSSQGSAHTQRPEMKRALEEEAAFWLNQNVSVGWYRWRGLHNWCTNKDAISLSVPFCFLHLH